MIMMVAIRFNDGTIISLLDATRKQIVKWINEAPNPSERSIRKQEVYFKLYNSTDQINLTIEKRK